LCVSVFLVSRFVNKMGGHIWVESEGPGKGTTVTFVVRLALAEKKTEELKKALKAAGQKAQAASTAASSAGADEQQGRGLHWTQSHRVRR